MVSKLGHIKILVNVPILTACSLITIEQLASSGLWNDKGLDVNFGYNKINKLPENIFRKFCARPGDFSINLWNNSIICEAEEIKWIFDYDYKFRISDTFQLKNVICVNMEYKPLLFMNKSDFNISSEIILIKQADNNPAMILFSILLIIAIIIAISIYLMRKYSSENTGSLIILNEIRFNKRFKVFSELGSWVRERSLQFSKLWITARKLFQLLRKFI